MNLQQALLLGQQSIRRTLRSFFLSMAGVAMGIAVMSFFIALALGVKMRVITELSPPGRLDVVLSEKKDSMFGGLQSWLADKKEITEEVVKTLRQHPDVEAVYPRMKADFQAGAWNMPNVFLKEKMPFPLPLEGLDPLAIKETTQPLPFVDLDTIDHFKCTEDKDCEKNAQASVASLTCSFDKDCPVGSSCTSSTHTCAPPPSYCEWDINQCKRPIPLVISPFIVDLYNVWVAKARGLEPIPGWARKAIGSFLTLQIGADLRRNGASSEENKIQRRFMVVGESDRVSPGGVGVPLPYVQRWNQKFSGAKSAKIYTGLWVDVKSTGSITRVVAEIHRLGFEVAKSGVDQVALALTLMTALFVVISFGIILLSIFNIAQAFLRAVSERKKEMGIMRALGANAHDLRWLLLGEAAAVGFVGGGVGLLSGWGLSIGVDLLAKYVLPHFPHKPTSFFYFSPLLCVGSLVLATVACVVGAYWPARVASRLSPAEVLSGS